MYMEQMPSFLKAKVRESRPEGSLEKYKEEKTRITEIIDMKLDKEYQAKSLDHEMKNSAEVLKILPELEPY